MTSIWSEYLDGECDEPERSAMRQHLEQCWTCRSQTHALQSSIETFVAIRHSILAPLLPPARPAPERLHQLLGDPAREPTGSPKRMSCGMVGASRSRFAAWLTLRAAPRTPMAGFLVALVVAAAFALHIDTSVSARTIMARADVSEFLRVRTAGRVGLSTVRIERIDMRTGAATTIGTVQTTRDFVTSAVSVVARGAVDGPPTTSYREDGSSWGAFPFRAEFSALVLQYLSDRQWFPSFDVGAYRRLLDGRGSEEESGAADGAVFELRHPFREGHAYGIREGRLLVDRQTFLPVQIRLFAIEAGIERVPASPAARYSSSRGRLSWPQRSPPFSPQANGRGPRPGRCPSQPVRRPPSGGPCHSRMRVRRHWN